MHNLDLKALSDLEIVTIVAHDAGGAEILACYVDQHSAKYHFVLCGPALKVFRKKFGDIILTSLEDALLESDFCLCGTGWQSDMEWNAIEQARQAGRRVIAFIDHWVNYKERFIRNDVFHLPDEIWVGDKDAKEIATDNFPDIPIRLVPNPYFLDIKKKISEIEVKKKDDCDAKNILFVCENISDHALLKYGDERYWGYTEFDAITFFLENEALVGKGDVKVLIRPHPSDDAGKYAWVIDAYPNITVLFSNGLSLIQEVAESDVVVGCESMAMVVGLLAQKKVISCIPLKGNNCRLPQKKIVHLTRN